MACDPSQLRATLTGKQRLKASADTTFTLSLINGGTQTCEVNVTRENFELKIYSGNDRIWSSNDCSTAVKPKKTVIASEKALEWAMAWNGRRSAKDCENRPELPRAGTYVATSQLTGAKPVQLRMILHG